MQIMVKVIAFALFVIGIANILTGIAALLRDIKKANNIAFMANSSSIALWGIGIGAFMLSNNPDIAYFWAKFYYVFPPIIGASLISYALSFPNKQISKNIWIYIVSIPAVLLIVLIISDKTFITSALVYHSWGKEIVLNQVHYLIYSTYVLITFSIALLILFAKSRTCHGLYKAQARFFFLAFLLASTFGVYFNLILPWIGNYRLIGLGPLFTSIFFIFVAFSIIRHKMFDLRIFVVRSIGYALVLTIILALYIVLIIVIGSSIFPQTKTIGILERSFYILFAIIIGLFYQPVKKMTGKLTNNIFYREAYDSQEVVDRIGSVIVGNVDSRKIQKGTVEVLSGALRPTFLSFLILDTAGKHINQGVTVGNAWQIDNPATFEKNLKYIKERLVLFDELEEGKQERLKEVLRDEDISFVLPLVTRTDKIGYLVGGPKKSGNIYNSQDVKLLNIAANELAVALQNAQRFEEIQAFNLTLQAKVDTATKELKITNKKLIALDEAKDEFISMASHQLRTPLTSIKGYISMMLDGDLGKMQPQQEKAMKEAFGSSQRMVFLIADFLNVSRIKTGKFMIEPTEVDLPQIVEEEILQLREMASSRDLAIAYDPPVGFPQVKLDENKIRQVMMNMVDNAIYYTPAGGRITIQLYYTGAEAIFKVIDTGIGVPKAEQHKLFTKFFRAGNARKSRPDGTGLGLFMAQKIIAAQGGSIIFESTEGKGSTFGFRFPLKNS